MDEDRRRITSGNCQPINTNILAGIAILAAVYCSADFSENGAKFLAKLGAFMWRNCGVLCSHIAMVAKNGRAALIYYSACHLAKACKMVSAAGNKGVNAACWSIGRCAHSKFCPSLA